MSDECKGTVCGRVRCVDVGTTFAVITNKPPGQSGRKEEVGREESTWMDGWKDGWKDHAEEKEKQEDTR